MMYWPDEYRFRAALAEVVVVPPPMGLRPVRSHHSRMPPDHPKSGDFWYEMLPCGSSVKWVQERGVWSYVSDTMQMPGAGR